MEKIEGIIFNELAGHRAVELPGVGVLRVVRRSAHVEGGAMVPPRNMVVFSVKGAEGTPSVINLGVAEVVYDKWLAEAMSKDGLSIGGVGSLQMGEFTPAAALDQVLNPGVERCHSEEPAPDDDVPDLAAASSTFSDPLPALAAMTSAGAKLPAAPRPAAEPQPLKPNNMDNRIGYDTSAGGYDTPTPRRRAATGALMAMIILLLLALVAVLFFCIMPLQREVAQLRNQTVDLQEQLTTKAAAAPAPVVEAAPAPEAEPEAAKPEVEKYHLIVGSFTNAEQAEKSADRYRRNYPNLTVKVFDNGAGRTYVSVFQSESRKAAYSRFYKIAEQTGNWDDMWVWERP